MASPAFKLYRSFSGFWANRSAGISGRFARSAAFGPAMFTVLVAGFVAILAVIDPLVSGLSPPWQDAVGYSMLVLAIVWILFVLLLIASRGATALHSTRHDDTPEPLLARCKQMLGEHGFEIENTSSTLFRAVRGKLGGWGAAGAIEKEWRIFPLEAVVSVMASQSGTALNVTCTGMGGLSRSAREFTTATARAIAELDGRAMERLDRVVGVRQGGLLLGGLASTVFYSLLAAVLLTTVLVAAVSYMIGSWMLDYTLADAARGDMLRLQTQLVSDIDRPLRSEIDRLTDTLEKLRSRGVTPSKVLRALDPGRVPGELVAGVRQPDGSLALAHPSESSPLRARFSSDDMLKEVRERPRVLYPLGERVFRKLPQLYTEDLAAQMGLKSGDLMVGVVLAQHDLARLAPRIGYGGITEITFFDTGRPFLRYTWPLDLKKKPKVDAGSGTIPTNVIVARRQELDRGDGEFSIFKHVLSGGALGGLVIKMETRDDELRKAVPHRVFYQLSERAGAGTGWGGFSVAEIYDPVFDPRSYIQQVAVLVALMVIFPVLIFMIVIANLVSNRISRPVLQVRDALRSIAEGDYSVRVETKRTDEIGQLQKLLNKTAEELRKRESIKELMGKYLSKQVADRIMESDSEDALAGTRKEVSVLFADVRGFTTYSEKHDPEQVTKSLNEYFEVMVDVIAAHEGVLDKYIGDGLMVVFGAPMAQPDHARRAVITALEMQAALQSLNLKRAQRGDEPIHIGIGVNTGLAISGNLGSIKRMEFTVIGDTVNLAARLENRADKGQILIGKATYEKAKELIESEPLGQITVKGKTEPVDIWWLKGLKPRKA